MRWIVRLGVAVGAFVALCAGMLWFYPRPPDSTEPRVFAADGAALNYCELPILDGRGLRAEQISKAFTPGCGWARWPMPILANCAEPLAPGVVDMRGLWQSVTPGVSHVERIEQCGSRTVITTAGIIHDFVTDNTLANGSRDVEPPWCTNTWASIEWRDGVMTFHPLGLPTVIVTRALHDGQIAWRYPSFGEVRMRRICRVPAAQITNLTATRINTAASSVRSSFSGNARLR